MCSDKLKVCGGVALLAGFGVLLLIIVFQASTGGDTEIINNPPPAGGHGGQKSQRGPGEQGGQGGQGGTQITNIVDKKWFENLLKMNIQRLVSVEINANSTTILFVSLGFGFCILLICGGLCAYCVYNFKLKKPAKKQKWNDIVRKINQIEKDNTAHMVPMAPMAMGTMAPRDYIDNMAAMQQAAMQQAAVQQAAVQQVKRFRQMYTFSQAAMANMGPTTNIGGMQQAAMGNQALYNMGVMKN